MALLSRTKKATAVVNGRSITVEPGETLLQAALRSDVDFPNSCRVGACGTCKCRLAAGKVRELTETGYLLTAEEIDQGYILACQSAPLSDVRIEVDLAESPPLRRVAGHVVEWEKATHDIVRLTVQLDEPVSYAAGQYARLCIEGLEGVERNYSFASPTSEDARVAFFIRRVPGGRFSSLVNDLDVTGRRVEVAGPLGEFFLRPSDAPLLLVAGGSGLAPILAMLEEAASSGVERSAILLFGARRERDLYALEEIASIARRWRGRFEFVPVLSEEPNESAWRGERGLLTPMIPRWLEERAHAYLCGPPAMIDGAVESLRRLGVAAEHIHFDRFTTQADLLKGNAHAEGSAEEAAGEPAAGLWDYMKYFLFHFVGLLAVAAILAGGWLLTAGLLSIVAVYMIGDAIAGDDTSTPRFKHPGVLTVQLWLALPLLSLIVFASVWSVCTGDPLGFGRFVAALTGYDVIAARDATSIGHRISTWILTGLMIGMVGTITAHELTHRTWDPISMAIGRWLLAFSFDTIFSIEHVYGHHRYVSTEEDPATAPRGRNVYFHILASTIQGNLSAWHIEVDRLRKKRLPAFSWRNAMIRGHLMSVVLVALAFAMGGWKAAAFFVCCALWGKSLLEIVNYMEHYGIVRDPRTPVQPRHSWNTNRRISSWTMFNLTRHSHHHAQGETPYQDLRPLPDAPMMINGYLTTIVVALIPPLWHRLMTPKLLAWDRDYATDEERVLARQANRRSGIPELVQAARTFGARPV